MHQCPTTAVQQITSDNFWRVHHPSYIGKPQEWLDFETRNYMEHHLDISHRTQLWASYDPSNALQLEQSRKGHLSSCSAALSSCCNRSSSSRPLSTCISARSCVGSTASERTQSVECNTLESKPAQPTNQPINPSESIALGPSLPKYQT